MSTRLTILNEIREIAAQQDRTLTELTDDLPLLDTGLDSLCFAILVSRLEDLLGRDPFSASDDVSFRLQWANSSHSMRTRLSERARVDEPIHLAHLIERGGFGGRVVATRDHSLSLDDFATHSSFGEAWRGCAAARSCCSCATWRSPPPR